MEDFVKVLEEEEDKVERQQVRIIIIIGQI